MVGKMATFQTGSLGSIPAESGILNLTLELDVCLLSLYCPVMYLAIVLHSVDHRFRKVHRCDEISFWSKRSSFPDSHLIQGIDIQVPGVVIPTKGEGKNRERKEKERTHC